VLSTLNIMETISLRKKRALWGCINDLVSSFNYKENKSKFVQKLFWNIDDCKRSCKRTLHTTSNLLPASFSSAALNLLIEKKCVPPVHSQHDLLANPHWSLPAMPVTETMKPTRIQSWNLHGVKIPSSQVFFNLQLLNKSGLKLYLLRFNHEH